MGDYTLQDVKDGKVIPKEHRDFIECVEYDTEGPLPRIHFWWETHHWIELESKDDHPMGEGPGYHGGKPHLWVSDGKIHHMWFCNFRRYGWSWTNEGPGLYGYGHSDVNYANGENGGVHTDSPREVVKNTMIASFFGCRDLPRSLQFCAETELALAQILKDALENVSEYASTPVKKRGQNIYCPLDRKAWEAGSGRKLLDLAYGVE